MQTAIKYNIPVIHDDIFNHIEHRVRSGNDGCSVIVPHVCNDIDLFGGGFTGAITQHYPIVKENYHLLGKTFLRNNPGYVQYVTVLENEKHGHKLIFANMIAQHGVISRNNQRPLNYLNLCRCMVNVLSIIKDKFNNENPVEIHAPKFGCGLAGGNWNFIQDLIKDIWKNQQIFIYQK